MEVWSGGGEVVPDASLVLEEVPCDDGADRVAAYVTGIRVTGAVAKPARERVDATWLQLASKDIELCHPPPLSLPAYGPRMRHVAFIRAIMVGREGLHREVILDIFRQAGAENPTSHLATGNVAFDLPERGIPGMAAKVDQAMTEIVGRKIEIFVRSIDELAAVDADAIYATSPFEPRDRLVTYFHAAPDLGETKVPGLIQNGRTAVLEIDGRDVYCVARELDGQIGAPGGILEKLSGQRVTTRAWATVEKVLAKNG